MTPVLELVVEDFPALVDGHACPRLVRLNSSRSVFFEPGRASLFAPADIDAADASSSEVRSEGAHANPE